MKKNQNGFSPVETILVLVVAGLIGVVGFLVYDRSKSSDTKATTSNTSNSPTPATKTGEPSLSEQYADSGKNFTIKYPSNWKLDVSTVQADPRGEAASEATLTSPQGTVLNLSADYGGKGGMCEPKDEDVPFRSGNSCASKEFLSSEVIPSINNYYAEEIKKPNGMIDFVYKKTDVVLTTFHHADDTGKSSYVIGLTQSNPSEPIEINKPYMGLFASKGWITVYDAAGNFKPYVYLNAAGSSKSFLTSKDGNTVKAMLKTVQLVN